MEHFQVCLYILQKYICFAQTMYHVCNSQIKKAYIITVIHIEKRDFQSYQFSRIVMQVCRARVDNNNKNSTVNHNGRRLIHGDMGTPICGACCKGDMCNRKNCFDLLQSKIILLFYIIVMSGFRLFRMFTIYFTIVLSQK